MPETTFPNKEGKPVEAWIKCAKCNGARHRIYPGEKTPFWLCQDERRELKPDQEIEVESLDPQEN